jgi:hypothetical protein
MRKKNRLFPFSIIGRSKGNEFRFDGDVGSKVFSLLGSYVSQSLLDVPYIREKGQQNEKSF